jgi:hypothetical protein
MPKPKTRTKFTFSSFSVRKLDSIHNECISEKEFKSFGENYFDIMNSVCYLESANQSYGCIPFIPVFIYFDGSILKNSYKFCKNPNITYDWKIYTECEKRVKPKCNSIDFKSKIETTKLLSNETILEFIPQKTPHIGYTETYKTDFNQIIYNCGGVLSLWFGLRPTKLVDIFKYLPLISKILISKSIKFVHYIKAISIRFAQNLISICKVFGLFLFRFGVKFVRNLIGIWKRFLLFLITNIITFAYNLIAIFTRFVRHLFRIIIRFAKNSFGICKRFGLYLFRIGVRFAQNLIRICKRFVLFFIANIITFAYNLIAILMRFVRHLFRMNSTEN